MKRLLTSAALLLCSLLTFAQFSGSGSGTSSDPYLILNPIQLNQLRNFLGQSGVYFKLMADIDLTEFLEDESPTQGWQPVGNSSSAFKGTLDGNGHKVTGFWISRSGTDYVGFFGNVYGTVKNLTLEGGTVQGHDNVGFLAGYAENAKFTDCTLRGNVTGNSMTGGCSGRHGDFTGIVSFVNVSGGEYVGGIVGSSGSTINNCYVYSQVSGNSYVGGILGYCYGNMNKCGFVGNLNGTTNVGGLIGYVVGYSGKALSLSNCFAVGSVTATNDYVGGLIGCEKWGNNISNCYFSGSVSGKSYTAGLVGYKLNGTVSNSYSTASVSGTKYVGGIVGYSDQVTIKTSVANNTRVTATEGEVARIVGTTNKGTIAAVGSTEENKSYNRTIVINQGVAQNVSDDLQNGTGVSATTLKLKATYVAMGWDFTNNWEIQETECFPYMKCQTAPPVILSNVVSGATTISGKCVDGGTITLEVDGTKQQLVSAGHEFSFTVSPLQAGHEVRVCAKAEGKEQSYFTTVTVSYLGKGTEADPYQIYTASDLTGVYRKGYFKLMNDIDLTSYINQFSPNEGWQSIGRDGSETIHFDGNGHKITGLWCNSTRDNTGLFSCFANGNIKNLTVETAAGKQVKGGANTGILIGKMMNGTIENCRVCGTVADGTPVGGLVGRFEGGKISRSQASVTIRTTGTNTYVGGIAGEITSGTIEECVTTGSLTATGTESYVGGLVGLNRATVTNCYSNATVSSTYNAAGLIAYNYSLVEKCYATGNIYSNNYGAGVIGYNDGTSAVVKNCAAMNKKIEVVYESQQVQQGGGYGQRIIGGIKNNAPAPELNNYALKSMQVSVNDVAQKVYDDIMNGAGKAGSDLVKASTYQELGWDFADTWSITEGEAYPSLKNNAASVTNPDADPEPEPEPDPEPVVTTDDQLAVDEVGINVGKTVTFGINLNNKTTDLTAYQFDLTLPAGITLAKNDKGKYQVTKTGRYEDDSQTLNVSLVEGNVYRFVCFSLSNDVISGTGGAILNVMVAADDEIADGSHEAQLTNIVFTKSDGTQLKLNNAKFNIVVSSFIPGDTNGDGEVNVADIVEIVNDILGRTSNKFVRAAADMNGDGEVNVTDIVRVVAIIMSNGNANVRGQVAEWERTDNDCLTLTANGKQALSLCLENESGYVASQFDLRLAEGQVLNGISLNRSRSSEHLLTYAQVGSNLYRVVVYMLGNKPFDGNSGELLNLDISGHGGIDVENIVFVTKNRMEKRFAPLHATTTGISGVKGAEAVDVYGIDGRVVRRLVTSTDGLNKGVYIIDGKKRIVR